MPAVNYSAVDVPHVFCNVFIAEVLGQVICWVCHGRYFINHDLPSGHFVLYPQLLYFYVSDLFPCLFSLLFLSLHWHLFLL